MKVILKILCIIGIIICALFSGVFFVLCFSFYYDPFSIVLGFLLGSLFFYLTYLCYCGIDRINHKKKAVKKVEKPITETIPVEEPITDKNQLDDCISLVRDCLNYKQTTSYPEIENELSQIYSYLKFLKDKNHHLNQYIVDSLVKLLKIYQELIFSSAPETPQGKEILDEINLSFNMINKTLAKITNSILDDEHLEVSSLVEGLKTKFTMDGYLNPYEKARDINVKED